MRPAFRTASALLGGLFTLQGIGWLVIPERAAASLGMPMLDGLARSTQIGDFAAFFLTLGLTILAAVALERARLLYFPAALLGSAAVSRSIAWAAHGAAFATAFILVEIAASLFLLAAARSAIEGRHELRPASDTAL